MAIEDFNQTIDFWTAALKQYDFSQLCAKPAPESWSAGQMYNHLIQNTRSFVEQMKTCMASNDNATEEASPAAREIFSKNSLPNVRIKGDPSHAFIPQPESKEKLLKDLIALKAEMNEVALLVSESQNKGKTRHPGFNFFSASEWLQFAAMHLRHHRLQKERIDAYLNANGYHAHSK